MYFLAMSAEKSKSCNTPVVMSTPITQLLVSKFHSPIKGTRAP